MTLVNIIVPLTIKKRDYIRVRTLTYTGSLGDTVAAVVNTYQDATRKAVAGTDKDVKAGRHWRGILPPRKAVTSSLCVTWMSSTTPSCPTRSGTTEDAWRHQPEPWSFWTSRQTAPESSPSPTPTGRARSTRPPRLAWPTQ